MEIHLEKIKELYGDNVLYEIKNNMEDVIENLCYLEKYQFHNISEILECYPYIMIDSPTSFKKKIDSFINRLGVEYQKKLNNNITLWGELL